MAFFLYLIYVMATFVRPIELFAPELGQYRPMMVLWAIAMLFAAFEFLKSQQIATRPANLIMLALLTISIGVSMTANGWAGGAFPAMSHFSTAGMLFLLTCLNLTNTPRVRRTCGVLVLSLLIVSCFGIASYHYGFLVDDLMLRQGTGNDPADALFMQPAVIPADDTSGEYLWRLRYLGFLNDPNDLAQAIVMVLPMLWMQHKRHRFFRNMIILGPQMAVFVYTIYLTHSRGALVGIAAMFFFGVRKVLGTARTAVIIGVIGAGAILASFGGDRGFSTQEASANDRIEAWYEGLQMLRSNPVFGVGYGGFADHHHLTAHNSFVLCFAELGLPGLFVWVALLVLAYRGLRQAADCAIPESTEHRLSGALLSSLIGYLTCAWFLSRTYSPGLYLLLAICASAAYCVRRTAMNSETAAPPQLPTWSVQTAIASCSSIVAVYGIIVLDRLTGSS